MSARTYGIGLSVLALVVSFAAVLGGGSLFALRDQPPPPPPPSATAPPADPNEPTKTVHIRPGDLNEEPFQLGSGVTAWRPNSDLGPPFWVCLQVQPPARIVGWPPQPPRADTYCRQLDGQSAQDLDVQVATS